MTESGLFIFRSNFKGVMMLDKNDVWTKKMPYSALLILLVCK
jgi:hypothetical protein